MLRLPVEDETPNPDGGDPYFRAGEPAPVSGYEPPSTGARVRPTPPEESTPVESTPTPTLPVEDPATAPTPTEPRVERPDPAPSSNPTPVTDGSDMRTLSSALADLFAGINARPAGGYAGGAPKPTAIVAPSIPGESGGIKPGWIILLLLAAGGGYWYYRKRKKHA